MLVVRRIEVGEVDRFKRFHHLVRVTAQHDAFTVEIGEDRLSELHLPADARECVASLPAERAHTAPILVESLENAGRVRVDRRFGEERREEEVEIARRNDVVQGAPRGIEQDRVLPRVERAFALPDARVVLRRVEVADRPGREMRLRGGGPGAEHRVELGLVDGGPVRQIAPVDHLAVKPFKGQKHNRKFGCVRRIDIFAADVLCLVFDRGGKRFRGEIDLFLIAVLNSVAQSRVGIAREFRVNRKVDKAVVLGGKLDRELYHILRAFFSRDVFIVLLWGEDFG